MPDRTGQSQTNPTWQEHEAVVERHKKRMEQNKVCMKKRQALAEHPFGILKQRAGMMHFLVRGLEKCRGEFSLMVLGYNFSRVLNILGVNVLRDYCAQKIENAVKSPIYA
ncbi:MAG: transposase [Methylococcales bacterium]